MPNDKDGFGQYLITVGERDIDLLLMEEFHVSVPFVTWFCNELEIAPASFNGAWHSVSDSDGETDLLLRVRSGDQRIGILIENKIAAPEQDAQDERYHLRGFRAQQTGKYDRFITCMCAPQTYLDGLSKDSLYQHRISYEDIAGWFGRLEGPRHAWRRSIMLEAITQSRRGYKKIVNLTTSEFYLAYWEYLRRHHPHILMEKPSSKSFKSNWFIMRGAHFPKRVLIHHKMKQRVVELGFSGRTQSELLAIKADWPFGIVPVQKGKIAVLSINVPEMETGKGIAGQEVALEAVFAAVDKLIPYAQLFGATPASLSDIE